MPASMNSLEALAKMEYPGRFIVLGRDPAGNYSIVAYGITGRSAGSQARVLKFDAAKGRAYVEPTDMEVLKSAPYPDLLVYDALRLREGNIAVSNGKQTGAIAKELKHGKLSPPPQVVLGDTLSKETYEPDHPVYTPRISGCIVGNRAGLHIIKRSPDGTPVRQFFPTPLEHGKGRLIATYEGPSANPLLSFSGPPREVTLEQDSPQVTAEAVWRSLNPEFRVSVVVVYADSRTQKTEAAIINRHELAEGE